MLCRGSISRLVRVRMSTLSKFGALSKFRDEFLKEWGGKGNFGSHEDVGVRAMGPLYEFTSELLEEREKAQEFRRSLALPENRETLMSEAKEFMVEHLVSEKRAKARQLLQQKQAQKISQKKSLFSNEHESDHLLLQEAELDEVVGQGDEVDLQSIDSDKAVHLYLEHLDAEIAQLDEELELIDADIEANSRAFDVAMKEYEAGSAPSADLQESVPKSAKPLLQTARRHLSTNWKPRSQATRANRIISATSAAASMFKNSKTDAAPSEGKSEEEEVIKKRPSEIGVDISARLESMSRPAAKEYFPDDPLYDSEILNEGQFMSSAVDGPETLSDLESPPRMDRAIATEQSDRICFFCDPFLSKFPELKLTYTNVTLLHKFLSPYGRIQPRKVTGNCAKHQRQIKRAIHRARYIGLMSTVSNWQATAVTMFGEPYRYTDYAQLDVHRLELKKEAASVLRRIVNDPSIPPFEWEEDQPRDALDDAIDTVRRGEVDDIVQAYDEAIEGHQAAKNSSSTQQSKE